MPADERIARVEEKVNNIDANLQEIRDNHIKHIEKKIDRMEVIIIVVALLAGGNIAMRFLGIGI